MGWKSVTNCKLEHWFVQHACHRRPLLCRTFDFFTQPTIERCTLARMNHGVQPPFGNPSLTVFAILSKEEMPFGATLLTQSSLPNFPMAP